jgi:quinol monooxygenase YgiN
LQAGKLDECLEQMLAGALVQTWAYTGCISVQTVADRHSNAVLLVEEWASDERQQAYRAWRVETGLFDALTRFLTGPLSQTTCENRPE